MQRTIFFLLCFFPAFLFGQNTYETPAQGTLNISDCGGILYDAGGPNGQYSVNSNSLVHIQGTSGDYLELTFTQFDVENNFDNLIIIEGDSLTNNIIGVFTGSDLPNNGQAILVPSLDVTIIFESDFTINGNGYAMEFACKSLTDPPFADINFPSFTCSGDVVFTDQSSGIPSSWTWDFGDGNTSTDQNPSHSYSVEGTYAVSLIACNTNGCDTLTIPDAITYAPNNSICNNGFTMSSYGVDTAQTCSGVLYDSGGAFGDYSPNNYGQFVIAPPGGNSISVTFSEFDLGNLGEHTDVLYFFDAASHGFLGSYSGQNLPNNGQTITFNVSSLLVGFSSDHENNFSGFSMQWQVNGSATAPVAAFSTDMNTVPFGSTVSFTDESANNPGIWEWDFGDGQVSNLQNPTHTYNSSGTFEVTMIATNCSGSDTTGNIFITVQDAPAITINPDSINVTLNAGTIGSQTVTICNNGSGDLVVDLNSLGQGGGSAYLFGFQTNENGADFSWSILDLDGNLIQQSQQTYAANQLYQEMALVPDPFAEYFLVLNSPANVQALDDVIYFDAATGDIIWQGFLPTGPNEIYYLQAISIFNDPTLPGLVNWLNVDNSPTVIAPGDCQDYEVDFDATELNGGIYNGQISINSNDPNQSNSSIPVELTVIGTPSIVVNPTTLDYGTVQVGASSTLSFTIENTGSDQLDFSGVEISDPAFFINTIVNSNLAPNTSQTIEVIFTPTENISYATSFEIINNAGNSITVDLLGNGIPSPSLTIDPTEFTLELIQGEDSTLVVNLGNIGEADLTYNATSSLDGTGFDFNFTIDDWAYEFSWELLDSQGNIVSTSNGTPYFNLTTYTESFSELSPSENYTLRMLDAFGDGALTNYTITDKATGEVISQGNFPNGSEMIVDLGSPTAGNSITSPNQGTLGLGGTQALDIFINSTGLATGTYNITVTVATNDPLQPSTDVNITLYVIAPVVTDFGSQVFVCGNSPVLFNDLTANVPTSWAWDLGDGTSSTLQNPSHTYATSGVYTISLISCNSLGCDSLTRTDYITVDTDCYTQNIPTNHGADTITICEGNVYDSGGPTGDYIEGNASQLVIAPPGAESVTITFSEFNYEEHGDFLYVYDGDGFTGTLLGSFTGTELAGQTLTATTGVLTLFEYTNHFVNLSGFAATFSCSNNPTAPIADFSIFGNDSILCSNQSVIFTDESQGNISQWFWDFGDGNVSNQQNSFHQYSASGTYNVSLTACNDTGCDTYIESITVVIDNNCVIDEIPTTSDLSTPVIITSCFGSLYDSGGADGNYADNNFGIVTIFQTGIGITFSEFDYATNDYVAIYDGLDMNAPLIGFYTGTDLPENGNTIFASGSGLTIVEYTDTDSNTSGFELTYSCPNIGFASDNNIMVMNYAICDGIRQFATPDTMAVDTWNWNFGDNTVSNEASPTHEFPHNGIFQVSLEACYQGNCNTYTTEIHSNKLTPEIMAPEEVMIGEEVQFEGMTMEATHWDWDFGNGEFSDHNTPTTVYTDAGYHDVHIHLINMNVHETCDANHTHTILVRDENSTSTKELVKNEILVYPNPADEFIQIDFDNATDVNFEAQLFTINGQLIRSIKNELQIATEELLNGTYILKVIQEDAVPQQFKIMVQHD